MGLLNFVIWFPIVFGMMLFSGMIKQESTIKWATIVGGVISFISTLALIIAFDSHSKAFQFVYTIPWFPIFNLNYAIGIDGISLTLIALTAFITLLVVVASWESVTESLHYYYGSFLILSGLMIGVFAAKDALLFYVFFEATLVPMYLIIGIWGGPNKIYAAFKFFLYTLLGSLLMLIALIYLYFKSGRSFSLDIWYALPLTSTEQTYLFFAFLAAFAVKIPMWPVHTWLPDVHVEAPTGGSAILAAIMLKLGAYGFIRFSLPIVPDASHQWTPLMITLSLIAVVYIGLVALIQSDMKKLVAYSSVAHMAFVTLGFFLFDSLGITGAIVQMISHGFVSAAMFMSIGVLYDRVHSREIASYGGVVHRMPKFAAFALIFTMANCGLPGTAGFVGEWMVILAAVKNQFWIGLLAAMTLILGAAYSLWMYKRVFLGPVEKTEVAELSDISRREFWLLATLAITIVILGINPNGLINLMSASVENIVQLANVTKLH